MCVLPCRSCARVCTVCLCVSSCVFHHTHAPPPPQLIPSADTEHNEFPGSMPVALSRRHFPRLQAANYFVSEKVRLCVSCVWCVSRMCVCVCVCAGRVCLCPKAGATSQEFVELGLGSLDVESPKGNGAAEKTGEEQRCIKYGEQTFHESLH